jgi:outer membrane usher protein FimD/PapC
MVMVTVSNLIEQEIKKRPLLQEALTQGIVSYSAMAEQLQPKIAEKLGKDVQIPAVVMALRRHAEKLQEQSKAQKKFSFNAEIIMKSNLVDVGVLKTHSFFTRLEEIYDLADFEKGDTLNIIQGNYEISIVINAKYKDKLLDILKDERIHVTEENLSSVSVNFSRDYVDTPGVLFSFTRVLAWNNINVVEIISTSKELTFIIPKKDTALAFEVLQELIEEKAT